MADRRRARIMNLEVRRAGDTVHAFRQQRAIVTKRVAGIARVDGGTFVVRGASGAEAIDGENAAFRFEPFEGGGMRLAIFPKAVDAVRMHPNEHRAGEVLAANPLSTHRLALPLAR